MTMSIGAYSGVSSSSLAQMRQQMFKSLDANGSGEVDATEFAKGPSGSGGMDSGIASALFSSFDSDSSGGLSQDELESGFQKLSASMRSVLIGGQESSSQGGLGGAGGPDGPPPPPPTASSDGSTSSDGGSTLDQLISLLESATGSSTSSSDGSDSTDDDTTSAGGNSTASAVRNDFKQLMNDLLKLTQQSGTGTQTQVTA